MSQRLKRMADTVQRELADLIRQIKDPRLTGLVTISAVKISKDLGYADVYVTIMGQQLEQNPTEDDFTESLAVLNAASGFLRQELGRRITTRTTPRLRFHYDQVTAYGNRMSALISEAVKDLPPLESDQAEKNE